MNPTYSYQQFIKDLRSTLNHFYEPNFLRHSPLVELLGKAGGLNGTMMLQQLLTDAIEFLHPPATTTLRSQAWRTYNLLIYRYLQQLTQKEAASQLGVSIRQLGREQVIALEILASYLWAYYALSKKSQLTDEPPATPPTHQGGYSHVAPIYTGENVAFPMSSGNTTPIPSENDLDGVETANLRNDLSWLQKQTLAKPADFWQELSTALEIVQPLAVRKAVRFIKPSKAASHDLPGLAIHPVALRQLLLSLLVAAVHSVQGRHVNIQVTSSDANFEVEVECPTEPGSLPITGKDAASLQMSLQLVQLIQGNLVISTDGGRFHAYLGLPIFRTWTVLMVDDNPDLLELFKRYLADTRYLLVGISDPAQIIPMVERHAPFVILLDVMMPAIDGWQLLGQLRHHPASQSLPVVICTIVAQEDLAFALGASDFLHKPVSRAGLLQVLDRLSGAAVAAPR